MTTDTVATEPSYVRKTWDAGIYFELIRGHILDVLAGWPDESVNCIVTSPPYWRLRDYHLEPSEWAGDPACEHKWISDVAGEPYCELCGAWVGCLGLEPSIDLYLMHMVDIFRQLRRVLKKDGTLWLNIGDGYVTKPGNGRGGVPKWSGRDTTGAGLRPKELIGMPWRVAFALQADGWRLRNDIIWNKPNIMPGSATDRLTKAHEYLFLFSKSARYYFDQEAIQEPAAFDGRKKTLTSDGQKYAGFTEARETKAGRIHRCERWPTERDGVKYRNKRDVWSINTTPYGKSHYATYPEGLVEPCVLAGCPAGGLVFDPFCGSGTTGAVAIRLRRSFLGVEIKPAYIRLAMNRLAAINVCLPMAEMIGGKDGGTSEQVQPNLDPSLEKVEQ
jgi:DNA modification methylase